MTVHCLDASSAPTTRGRRDAILEAALDCFSQRGFAQTTMEEIRERSRASTGSLYHHFKSKEQLAAELYLEGVKRYQEGLKEELWRHRSARRGIQAVVRYHLSWIEENPAWARYLMQSREATFVATTQPVVRRLNGEMFQQFADWIAPFVDSGEVVRLPRDLYGALLIGPVQHYTRGRLAGRQRTDPKSAARLLAQAAWQALQARGDDTCRNT